MQNLTAHLMKKGVGEGVKMGITTHRTIKIKSHAGNRVMGSTMRVNSDTHIINNEKSINWLYTLHCHCEVTLSHKR